MFVFLSNEILNALMVLFFLIAVICAIIVLIKENREVEKIENEKSANDSEQQFEEEIIEDIKAESLEKKAKKAEKTDKKTQKINKKEVKLEKRTKKEEKNAKSDEHSSVAYMEVATVDSYESMPVDLVEEIEKELNMEEMVSEVEYESVVEEPVVEVETVIEPVVELEEPVLEIKKEVATVKAEPKKVIAKTVEPKTTTTTKTVEPKTTITAKIVEPQTTTTTKTVEPKTTTTAKKAEPKTTTTAKKAEPKTTSMTKAAETTAVKAKAPAKAKTPQDESDIEAKIFGKYVVKEVADEEFQFELYDNKAKLLFQSVSYSTRAICVKNIGYFKKNVLIGAFSVEGGSANGYTFVLTRGVVTYVGVMQKTRLSADNAIIAVKKFSQTDVVK
ncbi:MAG TPA: hypothetical protein VJZ69_01995 [Clostridia bacterium]|nr:hypothetical protein [Clostridia bacterium]